jgi:hypothetical protein
MAARSNVDILEELMATEARLISIYEAGVRREVVDPALARAILAQEREHVRGLEKALADAGHRNPRAMVSPPALTAALRNRDTFSRFALDMETEAMSTYTDAAATIQGAELRQAVGSIMACEAAHVIALRESLGERPLVD